MQRSNPIFRALLSISLITTPACVHAQEAYHLSAAEAVAPLAPNTPFLLSADGKTLAFPGTLLPGNLVHFYFASQHAASPNVSDGIGTLLASPACTTSGCTVVADPLDPHADKFPFAMPDRTHFLDYRGGEFRSWYQNAEGAAEVYWYSVTKIAGDKGFLNSGNSIANFFQANELTNNATGWAYGLGQKSISDGEYNSTIIRNRLQIHAAGITNVFETSGTISKPDDVNYDNNNVSINPAAYGASSEGVTFHRDYLNYAPPYFGVIQKGGIGARQITLDCKKGCADMSLYTPLIDITKDVLSGNIKVESSTTLALGVFATLSTDFDVPASLYGPGYYIPAQTNVQGLIFSATTSGSGASVATVSFVDSSGKSDEKSVAVDGDAISIWIKRVDGTTRTLAQIAALFANGKLKTPAAGSIVAVLAEGVEPNQLAVKAAAKALAEVAAPRQQDGVPIVTTFLLGTSTPLAVGQMIDMMGPQFNEVTTPISVGKQIAGLQVITAPLYFSHAAAPFCANKSATPASGMVGRYIELTKYTQRTFDGVQRYVQTILCSPTSRTLLMGTIGYGGFQIMGRDASSQPAQIYHGADLRGILNPDDRQKTQQVNGPGYGIYAAVDANDTFDVGDTVENTPYAVQNWTKNKTFMDVEDPFATWHGYSERYTGPGLNGSWTHLINDNPKSLYKDRGGNVQAPDLLTLTGIWGGGITWNQLPTVGSVQSSSQPYLLYIENWSSTTQNTLGVFRASYGNILFNRGKDAASSFFEFGGQGSRNGIKAGQSTFDTIAAGQFTSSGDAPSAKTGAAAGRASTVRISGTNTAGVITLKTGTGSTPFGTIANIEFHGTLAVAPQGCSLMAREPNAASAATTIYTSAPDTATWSVNAGKTALSESATYAWSYLCM